MKKIGFIILLSLITSSVFGQQFLWSTTKTDSIYEEYIPLDNVTSEVIKFYDHYDYYYDWAGYSKVRFMEEIDYGFDDWKWLNDIDEVTVLAVRSNEGDGSIVLVLCVSEININLLVFTNHKIDINSNYESTSDYGKDKFEKWFKTLLK